MEDHSSAVAESALSPDGDRAASSAAGGEPAAGLFSDASATPSGEDLRAAAIEAIALLDVAIAGTVFTKPDRGRVVVNVARAQMVLDGLRTALSASRTGLERETGTHWVWSQNGTVRAPDGSYWVLREDQQALVRLEGVSNAR